MKSNLGGGWTDSVNTWNLNHIIQNNLFSIPGRGLPFGESITYNSLDSRVGSLGIDWRLGNDTSINVSPTRSEVTLNMGDGSSEIFYDEANGSCACMSPAGLYLNLVYSPLSNIYVFTDMPEARNR
jgi:hypothetical protein